MRKPCAAGSARWQRIWFLTKFIGLTTGKIEQFAIAASFGKGRTRDTARSCGRLERSAIIGNTYHWRRVSMSKNALEPSARKTRPLQPRFGLGALLMVMLVISVMAAAGGYMFRSFHDGQTTQSAAAGSGGTRQDQKAERQQLQLIFILLTLSAPMLLMVVVSLLHWLIVRTNRTRRIARGDNDK